jgi:conjugal transfer pilin signal peptidase TrbI
MRWTAALAAAFASAAALVWLFEATEGQWTLATDVQKYYRCLPYDWYFVTTTEEDFEPARGDLVQFRAPLDVERLTQAFEVIKIVAGVAGDTWEISNDRLFINGDEWGELFLLNSIDKAPGSLDGKGTVPEGELYVLGTNPSSYDSRYWGTLPVDRVKGKAHVLF